MQPPRIQPKFLYDDLFLVSSSTNTSLKDIIIGHISPCDIFSPNIQDYLVFAEFTQTLTSRPSQNHHPVGFCFKKRFLFELYMPHVLTRQFKYIQISLTFKCSDVHCKINKSNILRTFHQKQILAGTGFKPTTLSLLAHNQ